MSRVLEGQSAIVTGASSGIGQGTAKVLAAAGAKVTINYRGDENGARATAGAVEEAGGAAAIFQADVSDEEDVTRMFDFACERFGRVDILVANSGIQIDAPVLEMTLDEWKRVLDVNLTGQWLCCREAIRRFKAQPEPDFSKAKGKIVCMSSVHQHIPWTGHVNYAASKGGIEMMMASLAQGCAQENVRLNAVAPGAIATDINREAWETEEAREKLLKLIPYGRVGEPEDIGKAVLWLVSDESDYITGITLVVDGGMSLYPGFIGGG